VALLTWHAAHYHLLLTISLSLPLFTTFLQVMVDKDVAEGVGGLKTLTPTSTCVLIEGVLAQTPPGTKQKVGKGVLGAVSRMLKSVAG